jgi:hypothetical protein
MPTKSIKRTKRARKPRAKANKPVEPASRKRKAENPVPARAAKPQKRPKPETTLPEEPAPKRQKTAAHSLAPTTQPEVHSPPTGPITDAEVKAILSSSPSGVTIGSILSTFRPRISDDGKRDERAWGALVAALKRLSRVAGRDKGGQKRYKLKEE